MPQVAEAKTHVEATKRVSLSKILVTTDFSEVSDRALDYAIALARRYDARMYLAHVITPDPFQFAEPNSLKPPTRKSAKPPKKASPTFSSPESSAASLTKF